MSSSHHLDSFPVDEDDTRPDCTGGRSATRSSLRPRASADDPPPSFRPRLESTTYSIIPSAPEQTTTDVPPSSARPAPSMCDEALSPARRREIDAMYASVATLTLYELLGVNPDCGPAQLAANHDALAASFHPDRFAQLRAGTYQRKLRIILQRIHEAHAILSDPHLRADYDARVANERAALLSGRPR